MDKHIAIVFFFFLMYGVEIYRGLKKKNLD